MEHGTIQTLQALSLGEGAGKSTVQLSEAGIAAKSLPCTSWQDFISILFGQWQANVQW
jgi:hypothetical protein